MKTKIKCLKIFSYSLKELTDIVDSKNSNLGGTLRAMATIAPLVIIYVLVEYLWVKLFGSNIDKCT